MPDPKTLRVGDRIRILRVPDADLRQRENEIAADVEMAGWTANSIERIIAQTPIVRICRIDEYGCVWYETSILGADGTEEEHTLTPLATDSMATRRVIKSVLSNFLGTYVSRYSEYDGYLLFGFLVADLAELRFNLLRATDGEPKTPVGVAATLAVAKFDDQRQKAGLMRSQVSDAWMTIRRLPGTPVGAVRGQPCTGFTVSFLAEAKMDNGRRYDCERVAFVAPHNREIERQSAR